jgi:hypothetical protein
MTVREMNIDVRDQVQQLSTNRSRKLRDEHIDWYLNRTQQGLIESAIESIQGSGRYRVKGDKYGIITGLTVNRYSMSAAWNGEKYMSTLPANFWYLLDDGSRVSQLCKGDIKTIGHEVLNITRVPFPMSLASANFYTDLQLTYNNNVVFSIASLMEQRQIDSWNGFPENNAHFYARELLIQELGKIGIGVYWENYHTFNYPYHLIFVSTTAPVPITLQVDGTVYQSTNEQLTTEIHSSSGSVKLVPNSMVSTDKEMATSVTPYFKTSYISPISEKGNAVIYTHADNSFIVYTTAINYIRKPAVISLSLGTNCELSQEVHQLLCNKTAEMVMNRLDDPGWKDLTEQNAINRQ